MKALRLRRGDLVLSHSNDYQAISGAAKVRQDVRCALLEPLGNDRFHPGWGSTLREYVGLFIDEDLRFAVISEVNRVVGNYAAVQRDKIETDMVSGQQTRFTTDDIVSAVSGVSVVQRNDTLAVDIRISTVAGGVADISEGLA